MNERETDYATSRIPVTEETRELMKAQKVGGQTYDDLVRRMIEQYDPPVRQTALEG